MKEKKRPGREQWLLTHPYYSTRRDNPTKPPASIETPPASSSYTLSKAPSLPPTPSPSLFLALLLIVVFQHYLLLLLPSPHTPYSSNSIYSNHNFISIFIVPLPSQPPPLPTTTSLSTLPPSSTSTSTVNDSTRLAYTSIFVLLLHPNRDMLRGWCSGCVLALRLVGPKL